MNNIYIPSYKRYEKVRAYEYLGIGKIVVAESQKRQYEERYGDAVIAVNDKRDGSVSKKEMQYWILSRKNKRMGTDGLLMMILIALKGKKKTLN
jgi:hypothetical protein